jgi:hypothetical protein
LVAGRGSRRNRRIDFRRSDRCGKQGHDRGERLDEGLSTRGREEFTAFRAAPTDDRVETDEMYRLAEMSPSRRLRIGGTLLVLGAVVMVVGVTLVHIYGLGAEDAPTDGYFASMYTAVASGARHWFKALGYLVAGAASQMILAGATVLWVLNQKMTWARAAVAAFLSWMELVIIFGIVPSEWLNFSQTDLDWSLRRVLFDIPPWLLLGNEVSISLGAIKDAVSGGYNTVMLVLAGVFAYKIQDIGRPRKPEPAKEAPVSPYGRPLVPPLSRGDL